MRMAPGDFSGVATYRASPGIVRTTVAPVPVAPFRPTVAPISTPPRVVSSPVLSSPVAAPVAPVRPIVAAPVVPVASPISPISGQPINTSIFQPTSTPSIIAAQANASTDARFALTGSSYAEPQSALAAPTSGAVAAPAFYQSGSSNAGEASPVLGIDSSTWLVILVIIAAVVFMVTK